MQGCRYCDWQLTTEKNKPRRMRRFITLWVSKLIKMYLSIRNLKMAYNVQLITISAFSVVACALIFTITKQMQVAKEKFSASGTPASQRIASEPSMHFFAYNKCSPSCCDQSNYSCNSGCVCMSEAQRDALTTRSNNAASQAPDVL